MHHRWPLVPGAVATAMLLAGCSSGPVDVADGYYAAYASSERWSAPIDVSLALEGDTATFSAGSEKESLTLGEPGDDFTLCPPGGKGRPRAFDGPLTIGPLELVEPAIFGDCGDARPKRVTIVDLAAINDSGGPFPFDTWVEFCDLRDADCP